VNDADSRRLLEAAAAAREHAYAPYSGYAVGAAILAESGAVYPGANVENAAYPSGICAERVALFSAVAAGERRFRAIAVVTRDGGMPCGACRQALAEFGTALEVLTADDRLAKVEHSTLEELLPKSFGATNLSK
jgi:cytidine deaminase